MSVNISILKEKPSLTEKITIAIRPLAPLSMVAEMPGSFYKTLRVPNKKMLCGVFENIIGWHFSYADRKLISTEYKKLRKKEHIEIYKAETGSTYIPLLMDYFDLQGRIEIIKLKNLCFYNDLWNRSYRRDDFMHLNGCRNIGFDIIKQFHEISKEDVGNDAKQKWFKENIGSIPYFYTSPTDREYVSMDGYYKVSMIIDSHLLELLKSGIDDNNIGYLGNSEGWVDIRII